MEKVNVEDVNYFEVMGNNEDNPTKSTHHSPTMMTTAGSHSSDISATSQDFPNERIIVQDKRNNQQKYWMKRILFTEKYQDYISYQSIEKDILDLRTIQHQFIESLIDGYFIRQKHEFQLIFPLIEEGLSLRDLSWKIPQSLLSDQLKWMRQTLSALEYLHLHQLRHGNLSPENILILHTSNDVKLLNVELHSLHHTTNSFYISYERSQNLEYDGRDDLWSFGLIFAELLLALKLDHQNENNQFNQINSESNCKRNLLITSCLEYSFEMGSILQQALQTLQNERSTASLLLNYIDEELFKSSPHDSYQTNINSNSHDDSDQVVLMKNFLNNHSLEELINKIHHEVHWNQLKHLVHFHSSTPPPLSSYQALVDDNDGTIPIYRNPDPQPWDNLFQTVSFTPLIQHLKDQIEQVSNEKYNWCRILYSTRDNGEMSYHSDRYLDIAKGSKTAIYSIGQSRNYLFKLKKGVTLTNKLKFPLIKKLKTVTLHHNSVLLIGAKTNQNYLHSIEKHDGGVDDDDERLFSYQITFTFRNIATFYCPLYKGVDACYVYGQGVSGISTKQQMVTHYHQKQLYRHIQTSLFTLFGFISSFTVTSLLNQLFFDSFSSFDHPIVWISTVMSALLSRWHLIYKAKTAAKRNKWRHMVVYRLLNFFPLDPIEATRLLDNASQFELESLLSFDEIKSSKPSHSQLQQLQPSHPQPLSLPPVIYELEQKSSHGYSHLKPVALSHFSPLSSHSHPQPHSPHFHHPHDHLHDYYDHYHHQHHPSNDPDPSPSLYHASIVSSFEQKQKQKHKKHLSSSSSPSSPSPSSSLSSNGFKNIHNISLCLIIDILNDFILPTGSFSQTYGLDDTHRLRNILPIINHIYHTSHLNHIQVVLVTSSYQQNQFRNIQNLCCTPYGCDFPINRQENEQKKDIIHIKTGNSLFHCSLEAKNQLIQLISHQNIYLCGVTTVCCVRHAVNDVLPYANNIYITKDSVASRDSCERQEQELLRQWKGGRKNYQEKIHVLEGWNDVFVEEEDKR